MTIAEQAIPATFPKPTPPKFRNAAEGLDSLGNVPLERIVFDPLPGTAADADFARQDDREDRLCELIDGTLVEKAMGHNESIIAATIVYFLNAVVIPHRLGVVSGDAGMIRLFNRRTRMPDMAYFSFASLPNGKLPSGPTPEIVPDLAVDVLWDSHTPQEMAIKLAGTSRPGRGWCGSLTRVAEPSTSTRHRHTADGRRHDHRRRRAAGD